MLDSNNFARLLTSSTRLNAVPPLSASASTSSSSKHPPPPPSSSARVRDRRGKGGRGSTVPTYYVADLDEDEEIEGKE